MQPGTTCVFFWKEQVNSYSAFSNVVLESHYWGCHKMFVIYPDTAAFHWGADVRFLQTMVTLIA